jgi:hypothetical protein
MLILSITKPSDKFVGLKGAHKGRLFVRVFKGVSVHTYLLRLSMYVQCFVKKISGYEGFMKTLNIL